MMNKDINEIIKKVKDEFIPVGTIICYASPDCPEGYLPCDGREVLQSLYPKLYAVVKNRYGTPQNAQGFLLPDLRGLFVRGYDEAGNVDPERKFADIQEDAIQGHGHKVQPVESLSSGEHSHHVRNAREECASESMWYATKTVYSITPRGSIPDATTTSGGHKHSIPETKALKIISTGYQKVRVDTETRPKNICLLYCIKAKSECSTLRSEIEQLKKDKKIVEEKCDSLKVNNTTLKEQLKSAIDEKNAEEKEKLKWQSRCADYLRSDEALRKEKATLQKECISLQSKLDDERSTGWLWKAGLSWLVGLVLGCLYATLFCEQPVETQQQSKPITVKSSVNTKNSETDRTKQQTITTSAKIAKDKVTHKPDELAELSKAAAQGNKIVQYNMGWHYATGKGVKQNWEMAVKWYKLAAEQGQPDAQYSIGLCYAEAKGVYRDWKEAFKWFEQAAQKGHIQSQAWLGWCYAHERGTRQDWYAAASWYEKAAVQGDAFSQYNLGRYYENGQGVEKDYAKAAKWYKLAAEQGQPDAQYSIGLCYAEAKGVYRDWKEAFKWFEQAAQKGHIQSQAWLGWCYAHERGTRQDWRAAASWYEKAAVQGDAFSQYNLGCYYENGQGVEKDYAKAAGWYRKAAEQGQIDAQYHLGVCYELGNGVQKVFEIADKWYKKAAAGGQEQV